MKKNVYFPFLGVFVLLIIHLLCSMTMFANASEIEVPDNNMGTEVDIQSFESSHAYAKSCFTDNFITFNNLKDWILSEQCQAYYKVGPYPEEVQQSIYWAETRNQWAENANLYRSEPIFEKFDTLFTTYRVCDIIALNKNYEINLYENPATIVSFWILSEQYEYEDISAPPPVGYQEKMVIIYYTGTETCDATSDKDYIETLGDGWYLTMFGYDEFNFEEPITSITSTTTTQPNPTESSTTTTATTTETTTTTKSEITSTTTVGTTSSLSDTTTETNSTTTTTTTIVIATDKTETTASIENITATTETTTITATHIASDEELCEWAVKDYEGKTGVTPADAEIEYTADDTAVITLTDAEGNVLDVYTIDPTTGTGTESDGEEVNLPQTGYSNTYKVIIGFAILLTIGGTVIVAKSRRQRTSHS